MRPEDCDLSSPRRGGEGLSERAVMFNCEGALLVGVLSIPKKTAEYGVVILVGGPQYRSGSHRQFTLLARYLASRGVAALRFDYRGMGDGQGEMRNFEMVNADLKAAIDLLLSQVPSLRRIVLWGLCDAASAILLYAPMDDRVNSLVLLNPWVRSPRSAATTKIKHYYLRRLTQPSFWKKFLGGRVNFMKTASEIRSAAVTVVGGAADWDPRHGSHGYIGRMLAGRQAFKGPVLTILSGNDLVSREFQDLLGSDRNWRRAMAARNSRIELLIDADHTFSSAALMERVEVLTVDWVLHLS